MKAVESSHALTHAEKAIEFFAHLWVRNLLHDQMREIFHKTECEELKEGIRWVHNSMSTMRETFNPPLEPTSSPPLRAVKAAAQLDR